MFDNVFLRMIIAACFMVVLAWLFGKFGPHLFHYIFSKRNKRTKSLSGLIREKEIEILGSGFRKSQSSFESKKKKTNPYEGFESSSFSDAESKKCYDFLQQIIKGKREVLKKLSSAIENETAQKFPPGEIKRAAVELLEIKGFFKSKDELYSQSELISLLKSFSFLRLLVSDASFGDSTVSKVIEKKRNRTAKEVYHAVEFLIMARSGGVKKSLLEEICRNPQKKCEKLKLLPELKLARTILNIVSGAGKIVSINGVISLIVESIKEIDAFKKSYFENRSKKNEKRKNSSNSKASKREPSAYKVLGLDDGDSWTAIRKNYRKLAMKYHPDRVQSEGASETEIRRANGEFQKIRAAYDELEKVKKKAG